MQINTDLSPVVSPKSGISSSFTSPKDSLLPALNFNQIRPQNSGNLPYNSSQPFPKKDKSPTGSFLPVTNNQNNTTTTNESFSIEKNTYLEENSNRDSEESSNSEILILQGNSIEAENLNDEEEMAKTPSHPIHILEYEEFVLNENNDKSPLVKENFIEKSPNNQRPKTQKKITFPQNILPATELSEEPLKTEEVPKESQPSPKAQIENEKKPKAVENKPKGFGNKRNLKPLDVTEDEEEPKESKPSPKAQIENEKKSNEVTDLEFKSGTEEKGTSSFKLDNKAIENKPKGFGNKRNLKPLEVTEEDEEVPKESQSNPIENQKKVNEVTNLEAKSGNEEVEFKLNNKAFENKSKGFGNKRNLKPLDVEEETEEVPKESKPSPKTQIENEKKATETTNLEAKSGNEEAEFRLNNKAFENKTKGFGNKRNLKPLDVTEEPEEDTKVADFKQENSILKNEVQELNKRIQELLRENAQIKQERSERQNTGRESERIQREKEEIKNKFLLDENRALRDNQNKYQALIVERDEQIHQLRLENEEISKNSKNELYIPLVDKVRVLKEKTTQQQKQIDEQVEVIESKNIAIENLLFKMEKLTDSLAQKTNQVTELQEEIEKLKAAKESSMDYKTQQQQPKNVGSLYAKIRDKEKYWFSPEKRPETSDAHYRKSYSPTNSQGSERKVSRPNSSTAKTKDSTQKGVIKLATINQDNKSLDDQYSKSNHWSTLKWNMLNQREKLEKESAEKNQNLYKKMKNRSIDHYTHSKNDSKQDSKHDSKSSSKNESRIVENKKNTQNIEDLQKRLAYLKYKRQEFEKKKHDEATSKEDVKTASDILATTTSFAESSKYPVSKQMDSLISPSRNLVLGRYRESSMNKDDESRKNESHGPSQIYTHKAAQKAVPVYKSIELNPEVDMSYAMKNLKTSFTSKHGIHAKIDNYTSSTPSQALHHHSQQQAEEDFKNAGRYHSYSNVSKFFNKISENQKSYKRSYDLSSHTKIPELRSVTEASTKNKGDFFK